MTYAKFVAITYPKTTVIGYANEDIYNYPKTFTHVYGKDEATKRAIRFEDVNENGILDEGDKKNLEGERHEYHDVSATDIQRYGKEFADLHKPYAKFYQALQNKDPYLIYFQDSNGNGVLDSDDDKMTLNRPYQNSAHITKIAKVTENDLTNFKTDFDTMLNQARQQRKTWRMPDEVRVLNEDVRKKRYLAENATHLLTPLYDATCEKQVRNLNLNLDTCKEKFDRSVISVGVQIKDTGDIASYFLFQDMQTLPTNSDAMIDLSYQASSGYLDGVMNYLHIDLESEK